MFLRFRNKLHSSLVVSDMFLLGKEIEMKTFVFVVAAMLCGSLMAADDGLTLALKGEGKVMSWGFSFEREATITSEALLKGGEDVLKAIFKDAEVKGDKSKIEGVSGSFAIDKEGKITGKVKLDWTASGNPKTLSTDIAGKAELAEDGKKVTKISFKSEGGKVEGSWKHGDGAAMKTKGTGNFSVESK
ncbi:MAG: hypothetical protein A2Z34_02645 [Planctomycetes bacterium RBG_16_59_8]|nr:MAG: hypothetical protein A2Z34_02645 [Planctomycetes bacterium RBG_16_59_8]